MKYPEEYFDKIPYDFKVPNAKEWICEQILNAQKDAYNKALQDVEVNIECCMREQDGFKYPTVKWESISKLKIK